MQQQQQKKPNKPIRETAKSSKKQTPQHGKLRADWRTNKQKLQVAAVKASLSISKEKTYLVMSMDFKLQVVIDSRSVSISYENQSL